MSYEHCDRHDCDATNGCRACDREEALELTGWEWGYGYWSGHGWYAVSIETPGLVLVREGRLWIEQCESVPLEVVRAVLEHYLDPGSVPVPPLR